MKHSSTHRPAFSPSSVSLLFSASARSAFKAHKKYCSQFVAGVCFSILAEDPDKKDSKSSSAKGRDSVDIACVDAVAYAAWSQVLIKILGSGKVVPAGGR